MNEAPSDARTLLRELFAAGLEAVDPRRAVSRALVRERAIPAPERCVVLAVGKAAAAMAHAWHEHVGPPRAGLVVTREPCDAPPGWRALVGGHPLPTPASGAAGRAALAIAEAARATDALAVLLSGGTSALLSTPLPGLTLEDLRATTESLLRSGAEIAEVNCVRKHLSAASGGRLAAATRARATLVLVLSDVLGDDLSTIASGPCAPDPTTFADAEQVLRGRGVWSASPPAVRAHLARGVRGEIPETPKPGDACFARVRHEIVAGNDTALDGVASRAFGLGLAPVRRSAPLRGEARRAGAQLASEALALRGGVRRLLIAGGEPTVTVRGAGSGGRCQELALGAALALAGEPGVELLAASTDGSDGPTDAAGAFADGETIARGAARGLDAAAALAKNDTHAYFASEGGLFRTGPTGTNALDLALVLVSPRS